MLRPAVLLFGLWCGAVTANAQPVCNAFVEGASACLANKQCVCRFDPGGSMVARPAGYRWNCGALRPACELPPPSLAPAPLPGLPFPLPYADSPLR